MKELVAWTSETIIPGQVYGRYTVISTHKVAGTYHYRALCQCSCGSPPRFVPTGGLRNGEIKSCGCYHKEVITTHGMWKSPIFVTWSGMMSRCYNQKDKRFNRYGGRGISVCAKWHDVKAFVADMSHNHDPSLQIDRIDNDGNYSPENCRWATASTQARNKSNIKIHTFNGKSQCLAAWSEDTGIPVKKLSERLLSGWQLERALTTP